MVEMGGVRAADEMRRVSKGKQTSEMTIATNQRYVKLARKKQKAKSKRHIMPRR
jgi:hypothetical protein